MPDEVDARPVAEQEPLVPRWLSHPMGNAAWGVRDVVRRVVFHLLRGPEYGARLLVAVPRGVVRAGSAGWRWVSDAEGRPLRRAARDGLLIEHWLYLSHERRRRVRMRVLAALAGLVAAVAAFSALSTNRAAVVGAAAGLVVVFGVLGRLDMTEGRPVFVTRAPERRLTQGRLTEAFIAAKLAGPDRPISLVKPVSRDGDGWSATVDLPPGATASMAARKREVLAGCIGVRESQLFITGGRSARRVELWVADADPFIKSSPIVPFADGRRVDIWDGIPFGRDVRGRPVSLSLPGAWMLIGSKPRQGKSNAARVIAAAAALDPTVRLVIADGGKTRMDWRPFERIAWRYHTGQEHGRVVATLEALVADMDRRYQTLSTLPYDRCPGQLTREIAADPRLDMPLTLVVLDEFQTYVEDDDHGDMVLALLTRLSQAAPACGIVLLLTTQRSDLTVLPDGVWGQLGIRFALRTTTPETSDMFLGRGQAAAGFNAQTLDREGVGWLLNEGDEPTLVRTFHCPMATVAAIAEKIRDRWQTSD